MTLYLPDDLHERVKAVPDLNVSAVLQQALEAELERRETFAKLEGEMGDIELAAIERVGNTTYEDYPTVVFRGVAVRTNADAVAYITEHGRIAVYEEDRRALWVYEDLDELETDGGADELVADVADALGESRPIRLDI